MIDMTDNMPQFDAAYEHWQLVDDLVDRYDDGDLDRFDIDAPEPVMVEHRSFDDYIDGLTLLDYEK